MADEALNYIRRPEILSMMLRIVFVSAMSYYGIKWFMNQVDPTNKSKKSAKKKAQEQLKR